MPEGHCIGIFCLRLRNRMDFAVLELIVKKDIIALPSVNLTLVLD
jgi:hypothetical protein